MRAVLELVRPGNVATALADVLAGFAVAELANPGALGWLLVATACLYAGGVTLNDVFDRRIDAVERPERPIPSGRVKTSTAAWLGGTLLALGIAAASRATSEAAFVAVLISGAVLLYDAWGKHVMFVGPVNMGLCRGLNLVLGMAAAPEVIPNHWPLALIPLTYISAVTTISRGEVAGGKRPVALLALGLVIAVVMALIAVAVVTRPAMPAAALYAGVLAWRVVPAFWSACSSPTPGPIRQAVRAGVLSLVWVDAVFAAAYAGMIYSLAVLATAVLAGWLAKRFAVT